MVSMKPTETQLLLEKDWRHFSKSEEQRDVLINHHFPLIYTGVRMQWAWKDKIKSFET